ncbi:hypothetical protein PAXRUDRAFT_791804, partial [Paxillus rubicundulus Ve08.2h10]
WATPCLTNPPALGWPIPHASHPSAHSLPLGHLPWAIPSPTSPLCWAGPYPMPPIPRPTHCPCAISHPLAHPLPFGHLPWASPYPTAPIPRPTHCFLAPTQHHQVSIHWPTHYLLLLFSVTYSILLHPQLLDPWPTHTLRPTPFLGSPIGHGKYFPSAHPIPTAPPPPR